VKHFYKEIQGWSSFLPWYTEFIRDYPRQPSVMVELGCWKGRSAAFAGVEIANSGKWITFYTIDTFKGSDEPKHHEDPDVRAGTLEIRARANLAPLTELDLVRIIVQDSATAAGMFQDESVDFIFVDAAHTYEGVKADLHAWWPKLRGGGIMAGDDFRWKGVNQAVTEFFYQWSGLHTAFGERGDKCWRIYK
jgi:hypothetical protein